MKGYGEVRRGEERRPWDEEPPRREGHGKDVKLTHRKARRGARVDLLREARRFEGVYA